MANPNLRYVRLRPYDPSKGQVIRRYTYRGFMFVNCDGDKPVERWHEVDEAVTPGLARELAALRQGEKGVAANIPAFDVCTREEALALVRREHAERERVRLGVTSEEDEAKAASEEVPSGEKPTIAPREVTIAAPSSAPVVAPEPPRIVAEEPVAGPPATAAEKPKVTRRPPRAPRVVGA